MAAVFVVPEMCFVSLFECGELFQYYVQISFRYCVGQGCAAGGRRSFYEVFRSLFHIAWDWDVQQVGAEGVYGSMGLLHLCCGLSAYEFRAARREAREQGGAKQEERGTRSEAREQGEAQK